MKSILNLIARSSSSRRWLWPLFTALILLPLTGCMGPWAKRRADRQVLPIIEQKQREALGESRPFSIEPTTSTLTLEILDRAAPFADQPTTGGLEITLAESLALAIDNSREFQRRREQLYRSGLVLTAERHVFSPIFTGIVTGRATRTGTAAGGVERFGEVLTDFGVTKVLATGARISVGMSHDFFRFFTGDPREQAAGLASASIVQPLLRGGGYRVTLENLIQAERDVIYAVRDYARFEKNFIIDRVDQYYRLLQQRDQIDNEYQSYLRLMTLFDRAQAFLEAGRMPAFQVDQAQQDMMAARNRWLQAQTNYALALDQFKLSLGLPTEINIQPARSELARLREFGLIDLAYDLRSAELIALEQRLDLLTARDRAEDQFRRIDVVENALLPILDARFNARVPTDNNQPLDFEWQQRTYSAELQLELPLDRLRERNAYRNQLINFEEARRQAEQARDEVLVSVRSAWQRVEQARQSYQIQLESRNLAQVRIESVTMMLEAGYGNITVRDQLDANNSLLSAENALTRELVNYTIARLEFYNAIEQLEIAEDGMWTEPDAPPQES